MDSLGGARYRVGALLAFIVIVLAVLFWLNRTREREVTGTQQAVAALRADPTSKSIPAPAKADDRPSRAAKPAPEIAGPSSAAVVNCWKTGEWTPGHFRFSLDRGERTSGEASVSISALGETYDMAMLSQTSDATPLKGKRVELSADIRTRGARHGAILSLRADDAQGRLIGIEQLYLGYDADRAEYGAGMTRGTQGDIEWSTEQVLLDVPEQARTVTYGFSLAGPGQAWIDNVRIEVVAQKIPDAANGVVLNEYGIRGKELELISNPRNLDFEQDLGAPCS